MSDLKASLEAAMWVPKLTRDSTLRALEFADPASHELLAFALGTGHPDAVGFWKALQEVHLPKDKQGRLTPALQRHLVSVVGGRTVSPAKLTSTLDALLASTNETAPTAQAAVLALGQGVSLANAHGIYVAAARKAPLSALPKTPPHLGGPTPELSVYETVELAIGLAKLALQRTPHAEGAALVARSAKVLGLVRAGKQSTATAEDKEVPRTSKAKGPSFALARASLMEAWNTDHVSGRGTSIKGGVQAGLELDPAWWLTQVDEQVMLCDARTAWERKDEKTSSPLAHLVWRGGDKTTRLWLARLASGRYALLAKLGRNWTSTEGDLESVAATIPDTWFARAMPVIESRR